MWGNSASFASYKDAQEKFDLFTFPYSCSCSYLDTTHQYDLCTEVAQALFHNVSRRSFVFRMGGNSLHEIARLTRILGAFVFA